MTTWYLVRHGETEWNAVSRMQGQLDSRRLTPLGRQHAKGSRESAGHARRRCRLRLAARPRSKTLAIIHEQIDLPAAFDDRLKEWSAGDWSGELYSEVPGKWPGESAAWQADR